MSAALFPDILAFTAALVASVLLTPAVRDFAIRRRYVDMAGSVRKIHKRSIPRLGGVAIFAAWLIGFAALVVLDRDLRDAFWSNRPRTVVFVLGGIAVAALGCVDDVRGLRARYKLAVQLAIGLALCWAGFTVHAVQLPGGLVVPLGPFAVPFTALWVAGVMNAMNLIDGLDGLAAGIAAIALSAVFIFALVSGNALLAIFSAALAGAVMGFLFFNFNPASIFMGDAGSLVLGYFLAVGLMRSSMRPSNAMELLVPLLVLGVPICDMLLAIWRRALRGRGLFSPDREHLHHRLLAKGFSHRQAVYALYGVAGLLAMAGIVATVGGDGVDVGVAAIVAIGGMYAVSMLRQRVTLADLRNERRRNHELRGGVAEIVDRLQSAMDMDHVIETMRHVQPLVSAAAVRTRIGDLAAEYGRPANGDQPRKMEFALATAEHNFGHLEVVWDQDRAELDSVHTLALEEICDNVVQAVRRVSIDFSDLALPEGVLDEAPVKRRLIG